MLVTTRLRSRHSIVARRVAVTAVASVAALSATAVAANTRLTGLLFHGGDETGFSVFGQPATQQSIAGFVEAGPFQGTKQYNAKLAKVLKLAKFVGAADETLTGPSSRGGSVVIEFATEAGAKAALAYLDPVDVAPKSEPPSTTVSRFSVTGVPSAIGVLAVGSGFTQANVYWVEGRCAFAAANLYGQSDPAAAGPLIGGVQSVLKRSIGKCS